MKKQLEAKDLKVRYPAYAGRFYAGSKSSLKAQIESCFKNDFGPGKLPKVSESKLKNMISLVCPHAGYEYSGYVAAHGYYRLAEDGKPDVVVFFGPNHTGVGSAFAIVKEGFWRTPFGDLEIDSVTASSILEKSSLIDVDESAQAFEHSIEVQLPFLQFLYGSTFKLVPICFLRQELESSREIGIGVGRALIGKNALLVASTDLTHYEPCKSAEEKDKKVIDAVLKLDEHQIYSTIKSYNISMCGYGPTIAAVTAAKVLGANTSQLLCYKTSGAVTSEFSAVVGYASIALTRN